MESAIARHKAEVRTFQSFIQHTYSKCLLYARHWASNSWSIAGDAQRVLQDLRINNLMTISNVML